MQAQFTYTTNAGAITITGYTGTNGSVAIPSTIYGLPVTSIGNEAFESKSSITNITIPGSITNIGESAFASCTNLTNVNFSQGVTSINGFYDCPSLTNVTIPASVTNFQGGAFRDCTNLTRLFFAGNAAGVDGYDIFSGERPTVYRLPGASGWSNTFDGLDASLPVVIWNPLFQVSGANFGVSNHKFGFTITNGSTTNIPIVIEACSNLANPIWTPSTSLTLTNTFHFSESLPTNSFSRFYRIRSP